ncbi:MAG: ABC transporter substrate-binding protein [Eubacteriales bacterium]|nr:ABC transporter substrate-binding protein [Eubacteriales bacterium]
MLLVLAVGCTDVSNEESTEEGASEVTIGETTTDNSTVTDEEITITYQTESASDMFTAAFAVYQESHPNVKLEVQVTDAGTYAEKLVAQAATGTNPDVTWWNARQYVGNWDTGAFLDLTDIINEQFADRFIDGTFLMSETNDGVITCFPCEMQIQGFLINTVLFDQYNLDIPETFDDLINCAEVFAENGISLFGNGTADGWPTWGWFHWFELWGINELADDVYGTHTLKFADSDAATTLYKLIELYEAGAFPYSNSTVTYDMTKTKFLNEECASMTTSTDWLTDIVGSGLDESGAVQYWLGATFDDSPYDQNTCVKMVGNGYGVSSQISDEKLTVLLDFFDWFYSTEGANVVLQDGLVLPINFDVTSDITPLTESIIDLTLNTERTGLITSYYAMYDTWGRNTDITLECATLLESIVNGCIDGSITADDLPEYLTELDADIDTAIAAYEALE